MNGSLPHYLLFCDGNFPNADNAPSVGSSKSSGRWKFVLEHIESGEKFEATDRESGATSDRTALIAVLRGLEALEQPSRVTLVTTSRYVFRGLQYGLTEWRENDYSWEHFGAVQPIRNADIWRRIDRTLAFHKVQCRWISQDPSGEVEEEAPSNSSRKPSFDPVDNKEKVLVVEQVAAPMNACVVSGVSHSKKPALIYRDSGETMVRESDKGSASLTDPINYLIEEVEKKPQQVTEVPTKRTNQNCRVSAYSRIDFPIHIERDSTESAEPCREKIGPPPPKFLRKLSSMRSSAWRVLMRLDEEIEGYLRCLLLMEPRPPRRDL